eukprot:m.104829 g.104829  ORF g.104829 m.104829 type:complete len:705 (-) comp9116_c0_seq2:384-2498(-)
MAHLLLHPERAARTGFSVDSEHQDERLEARKARRRARAAAEQGEEPLKESIEIPSSVHRETDASDEQTMASKKLLDALREEGNERVSSVRVAADYAESKRRAAEERRRTERAETLDTEQAGSLQAYEVIASRWDNALRLSHATDLQTLLEEQRALCNELIGAKDTIIEDCRRELKARDDEYVKNLRAQASDIDTLMQYMTEQIDQLNKEYAQQLEQIERTFMQERGELLEQARAEWKEYMDARREGEEEYVQNQTKRIAENESMIDQMYITGSEEYSQLKIKLETDIQNLEQQLMQMRATYQLNAEKLEYNYQVLKKRDEENTILATQQKRKINRLHDQLNGLKKKIQKLQKQYHDENAALTEDYKRIAEQFQELQKKFQHFQATDVSRYDQVFEMNEETNVALAKKLLAADQILFEQQLGLQWLPPHELVFDSSNEAGEELAQAEAAYHEEHPEEAPMEPVEQVSQETIRRVFDLLCDEAGFLLEAKLDKLLAPLSATEQSLVKLDTMFKALGIDSQQDIVRLAKYFIKKRDSEEDADPGSEASAPELVHPNEVSRALKEFAADHRQIKGFNRQQEELVSGKNHRRNFWADLLEVVPEDHDRVWDALLGGLEKYSTVLEERASAIESVDNLKLQNSELRMLLQQYVGSEVCSRKMCLERAATAASPNAHSTVHPLHASQATQALVLPPSSHIASMAPESASTA